MGHPFVVQYHFADVDRDCFYIGMENVSGPDLFTHLMTHGPLDEPAAQLVAGELALALGHLHSLDIVHADVKSENILIDPQGHVKLTDFGSAVRLAGRLLTALYGTPDNMAPELLLGYGWNQMVDWWAFGCVVWETLTTCTPFWRPDQTMEQLIVRIMSEEPDWESSPELIGDVRDLLAGLLHKDPTAGGGRLGSPPDDYAAILAHRWFDGLDKEMLAQRALHSPIVVASPTGIAATAAAADDPLPSMPAPEVPAGVSDSWTPTTCSIAATGPDREVLQELFKQGNKSRSNSFYSRPKTAGSPINRDVLATAASRLVVSTPANFESVVKRRTVHARADPGFIRFVEEARRKQMHK